MTVSYTKHYSIGRPAVGGSLDVWGTELNTALDVIDTSIKSCFLFPFLNSDHRSSLLFKVGDLLKGKVIQANWPFRIAFKCRHCIILVQEIRV